MVKKVDNLMQDKLILINMNGGWKKKSNPSILFFVFLVLFLLNINFVFAGDFVSTWNTSATSAGSSNSTSVKLPLESGGTYNFTVYWGDGSSNNITAWNQAEVTHGYASEGNYTINISGIISGFIFNNAGDKLKLINILQWGDLKLGNSGSYFYGASNLNITATDILNIRNFKCL